jgi:hypothetical protein
MEDAFPKVFIFSINLRRFTNPVRAVPAKSTSVDLSVNGQRPVSQSSARA